MARREEWSLPRVSDRRATQPAGMDRRAKTSELLWRGTTLNCPTGHVVVKRALACPVASRHTGHTFLSHCSMPCVYICVNGILRFNM